MIIQLLDNVIYNLLYGLKGFINSDKKLIKFKKNNKIKIFNPLEFNSKIMIHFINDEFYLKSLYKKEGDK